MVTALCFITVEPDRVNDVGEQIARIPQARTVYSVTGQLDLVAIIEVSQVDDIATVVTDQISALDGIISTETHIAFRTYSKHDLEAAFAIGLD